MKLIGSALTSHDQTWYDGKIHWVAERYSRVKGNRIGTRADPTPRDLKSCHPNDYGMMLHYENVITPQWNEYDVMAMSIPRNNAFFRFWSDLIPHKEALLDYNPKTLFEHYYKDNLFYADHHQAHAAYSYIQSGFDECDVFAIDGGGNRFTSFIADKDQNVTNLSNTFNLGRTWIATTSIVGKLMDRRIWLDHEVGKVMGLAAFGKVDQQLYPVLDEISRDGGSNKFLPMHESEILSFCNKKQIPGRDLAATMQQLTYDRIMDLIKEHKTSDSVALSGGVAYNGYMNEMISKIYKNVYIPPALGDEGQSLGMYMMADYVLNNNTHIPPVYAGVEHEIKEEIFGDMNYERMNMDDIYPFIAKEIANGAIVGWYQGRSESGNRALGNRSILADPRNPEIKNIINRDIKKREDFRPFAPSVLIEDYQEYFDTNQPSPYMSRIMPVKEEKKSVVPGIVHVDGTARIQTVDKSFNEKYWKLISAFKEETGVPMLLNTSFNCQEPIVETPQNAVDTFKRTGLHYLVIEDWVCKK
jgi:carbamoyltransferase